MAGTMRPGLRAQLVLALGAVFLVSFAMLGLAAIQLTRRAAQLERQRSARTVADAMARALSGQDGQLDDAKVDAVFDNFAGYFKLAATRVDRPDGSHRQRGNIPDQAGGAAELPGGGQVRVWLAPRSKADILPLGNLLLFYVAMTGVAVLLMTYISLTNLIVRPLEQLTRSSEQLAAGNRHVKVAERGATEVVRLASAFNTMASLLRAERRALEERLEELERTTDKLRNTQQQLAHGEKLASVGRLAAGVAHEIGNPLAAILGLVELLRGGGLEEAEAQEFLRQVHAETERINQIIRDLLDFSHRDEDAEGQTASVGHVITDAVNLVRPQKESKAIDIKVDVDENVGRVLGPQHRLTQIVLNLLLNAVDALKGSGTIEVSAVREDASSVLMTISDDGPGIASDMIDRLFDPFTTSKPVGEGTGLGLAVTHALVEGLGGSIRAYNRAESGACFEVRLRSADRSSRPPTAAAPTGQPHEPATSR